VIGARLAAAEERFGERPFLVTHGGVETFAEAAAAIRRAAGALRERGVAAGDRVLLRAPNSLTLVHAWLGAVGLGALPAAVNPKVTDWELEYMRNDLEPRTELHGEDELAALDEGPSVEESAAARAEDPAAIVYTSGTTSRPKGVLVTHGAYVYTGESVPSWFGLGVDERLWACLPLFHINAQAYSLMTTLCNGYSLALTDSFHASTFWQDAAALGATETNVIGAMLAILSRQPEDAWVESPLRTMYATPALDVAQRRALERRFRLRIVTGYGMTESPFGCIESPTSRDKESSVGRPRQHPRGVFENKLRVVTEAGRVAATGEVGEIQLQSPVVTPGYWKAPEITERVLAEGWLHTGDAGYVDADGDVMLVGRYKSMIRRRGENISPQEVEDVLLMHPAVELVAVVGIPSDLSEEEVAAAIVLAAGADVDAEELSEWCAQYLAPFKVPSRFVVRESLPMTATMRVSRDKLVEEIVAAQ
jgi:crotonobetaine/carnitine-CoA ligase